jgi:hypothetical protein
MEKNKIIEKEMEYSPGRKKILTSKVSIELLMKLS